MKFEIKIMKTKSRRPPGLIPIPLLFVSIFVIIYLVTNTSAAKDKKEIEKRVGFYMEIVSP